MKVAATFHFPLT